MARLEGKIAIITGATSGIGERSVELFVEEGAQVVFCGRREELGRALAARVGPAAEFIRADVAVEDDVANLIDTTVERHGRLDVLFNNAGGPAPTGSIADIDTDFYDRAMKVLVGGVMLGMKHAAPVMIKQGSGSIINNGSIAGHQAGYSSSMIYSAAKAAVIHLSRCVAMELGEQGVRVNSVAPGYIETTMTEGMQGNGPVDGHSIDSRITLASAHNIAADVIGLQAMGYRLNQVGYLRYAMELRGLTLDDIEVVGEPIEDVKIDFKSHDNIASQLTWPVEGDWRPVFDAVGD